ncbi:hypothetical protein LAV72_22865 [Lysinibacillus xylanilyticus]|uniref:ThiF family adenylyltransferase n=1 Tax=Lysinibacillus xylanilyticus TaxID=582475 RepID=UPI002B253F2B|nr:hypothetical protein [Lysinibacillus xylanilyticus]MEB2302452.1 hypothetical protein [Lysinibacillus xylanilyticus]
MGGIQNKDLKFTLKNDITIAQMDEDEITIKTASRLFKLKGNDIKNILIPNIENFEHGVDFFTIKNCSIEASEEEIHNALGQLTARGWLTNLDTPVSIKSFSDSEKESYESIGVDYSKIQPILDNKTVGVISLMNHTEYLVEYMLGSNIKNINLLLPNDFAENVSSHFSRKNNFEELNLCSFNYLNQEILENHITSCDFLILLETIENKFIEKQINKLCLKHKKPFIRAIVQNFKSEIGPLVIPNLTACLECYNTRIYSNLNHYLENKAIDQKVMSKGYGYKVSNEVTMSSFLTGIGILTNEVIKYFIKDITWNFPASIESIIEFDNYNMELNINKFLKIPRCEICGKNIINNCEKKYWMEPYSYQK